MTSHKVVEALRDLSPVCRVVHGSLVLGSVNLTKISLSFFNVFLFLRAKLFISNKPNAAHARLTMVELSCNSLWRNPVFDTET